MLQTELLSTSETASSTTATSLPADGSQSVPQPLLNLPPIDFERCFSREPFLIGHSLCQHPLFQVDRLLELTKTLPEKCIEYNAGNLPISLDEGLTPRNGLSPEETVRRIAECRSWIVLKYVEQDPAYAELLNTCLELIKPYTEPICPGMRQPQAFIFLTSPGSVTPYHIDPEHNFLLQIQGSKQIRMLDGRNSEIVSHEHLENFYSDRGRNLKLKPQHVETGWSYELQPGQGLHFPVTFPHWVKNGDAVSISFSITFRTPDLDRRRALYQVNGKLRQRGWTPTPVGQNLLRDALYYHMFRLSRRIDRLRHRSSTEE